MHHSVKITAFVCLVLACTLAAPTSPLGAADAWKRYAPVTGISLELPGNPTGTEVPISPETRKFIQSMQNYSVTTDGLYVLVSFAEYTADAVVNLQNAADGAVNGVKGNPGVTDFKVVSRTNCTVSGKPAIRMICTYKAGGMTVMYDSLQAAEGRRLWQIVAGYIPGSTGQNESARVFKSVKINP